MSFMSRRLLNLCFRRVPPGSHRLQWRNTGNRVSGVDYLLESFEPIDGILLCEGEDINPSLYSSSSSSSVLSSAEIDEIRLLHSSDVAVLDSSKDSIELRLTKVCLSRSIPFLGICRGSQLLNVACGGTLYADVETELAKKGGSEKVAVKHINYDDYDGYRHRVRLVEDTPLYRWFKEGLEIEVNSYHHQGVKKLAERFVAMAFAEDGLIEGFYDPEVYDPEEGKFLMGLQFHPERMRKTGSDEFDYLGCPRIYQEFVKAVTAYHRKNMNKVTDCTDLNLKFEQKVNSKKKKKTTSARRPSLPRDIYIRGQAMRLSKASDLQPGAESLELSSRLGSQLGLRLFQTEATVEKTSPTSSLTKLMILEKSEEELRRAMEKKSEEQLCDLLFLYQRMGKICSDVLERKLLVS